MYLARIQPSPRARGFSLLEILVALVILSTVLAIAVPRLRTGMELHLKASSRKLSSNIRFAYFESVAKNRVYRMGFSVGSNNETGYWIETADRVVRIRSAEAEERYRRRLETLPSEARDALLKKEVKFTRLDDGGIHKLPNGVFFKNVYVDHQAGAYDSGTAYLYFFPSGQTEYAVINLEDRDGNPYSLEVQPLTGKVITRGEAWSSQP